MQFTYKVSEAEYRRALKLRFRGGWGSKSVVRTIIFWVFILVCLMMLWAVVSHNTEQQQQSVPTQTAPDADDTPPPAHDHRATAQSLLVNVGPFVLIVGIWCFMLFQMAPRRMRKQYLNDPTMQGTYTIDITPDALSVENTAGVSSRMVWNLYDYWQERNGVFVLVNKSGTYFIISSAGLSEPERDELRTTLASVLQKK